MAKRKGKLTIEDLAKRDPEIRRMLDEPVGTPVKLTPEQAAAISEAGIGSRPDLPPGSKYVKGIKKYWHSLVPSGRRAP